MEKTFVTGQTLIGEIVANYPDAVDVLYECGMRCSRHRRCAGYCSSQ